MTTVAGIDRTHRESAAVAVFGAWMIGGLFLDGWAHQAEKPETFFSPWHGILYSGFAAAVAWFAWDGWRHPGVKTGPADRIIGIGLITFIIGAIGDGFWHEIFGIEVDLEALVSPSHLALLIGGFLMVSSPLRIAAADPSYRPTNWRAWFPQGVTLTLCAALLLFFTQYLSAFGYVGAPWHRGSAAFEEFAQVSDLASVLATNAIIVAALLWAAWRWRTPFGAFTLLFTASGVLLSGLEGFDIIEVAIAFLLAGLVADVAVSRGAKPLVTAGAASLALWSLFFFIARLSYGMNWSPELWAGAIVLAAASSVLMSSLLRPVAQAAVVAAPEAAVAAP